MSDRTWAVREQRRWIAFAILLIATLAAARFLPWLQWMEAVRAWSAEFGFAGVFLYGAIFGLAALLMLPCLPLTILAGFTFGWFWGLVSVMLGTSLGAAFGFLFARYAARDFIARKLERNRRFKAVDAAIAKDGWKVVALLRMCPVPFGLFNYLYGLTAIEFRHYLIATMVGMLPGNLLFVYLGAFGKRAVEGPHHPAEYALGALALAALITVTIVLRKIAQRSVQID